MQCEFRSAEWKEQSFRIILQKKKKIDEERRNLRRTISHIETLRPWRKHISKCYGMHNGDYMNKTKYSLSKRNMIIHVCVWVCEQTKRKYSERLFHLASTIHLQFRPVPQPLNTCHSTRITFMLKNNYPTVKIKQQHPKMYLTSGTPPGWPALPPYTGVHIPFPRGRGGAGGVPYCGGWFPFHLSLRSTRYSRETVETHSDRVLNKYRNMRYMYRLCQG